MVYVFICQLKITIMITSLCTKYYYLRFFLFLSSWLVDCISASVISYKALESALFHFLYYPYGL